MSLFQWSMNSPFGPLYLLATEKGLRGIYWRKQEAVTYKRLEGTSPEVRVLLKAEGQLKEYFAGKRQKFDLKFDFEGTAFQKQVWHALAKIPYGETRSYAEIASSIRNPKAVRAVGTANGKNPLCILIPCHRVVRSTGEAGGYAGGLRVKSRLLALERPKV